MATIAQLVQRPEKSLWLVLMRVWFPAVGLGDRKNPSQAICEAGIEISARFRKRVSDNKRNRIMSPFQALPILPCPSVLTESWKEQLPWKQTKEDTWSRRQMAPFFQQWSNLKASLRATLCLSLSLSLSLSSSSSSFSSLEAKFAFSCSSNYFHGQRLTQLNKGKKSHFTLYVVVTTFNLFSLVVIL